LYTSCMLRGAFTLFIKFSTYLSKKKKKYRSIAHVMKILASTS